MSEDLGNERWMQTFTGKKFYPRHPRVEDICLEDIAHALSHICRFGGHCAQFYSVAQHSILVASALPVELKAHGLLHDAGEAYLGDVIWPLKHITYFRGIPFSVYEEGLQIRIFAALKIRELTADEKALVKNADTRVLMAEARDLMNHPPERWSQGRDMTPLQKVIYPLQPRDAELEFLDALEEVGLQA